LADEIELETVMMMNSKAIWLVGGGEGVVLLRANWPPRGVMVQVQPPTYFLYKRYLGWLESNQIGTKQDLLNSEQDEQKEVLI
jgi:hypothetical protein